MEGGTRKRRDTEEGERGGQWVREGRGTERRKGRGEGALLWIWPNVCIMLIRSPKLQENVHIRH